MTNLVLAFLTGYFAKPLCAMLMAGVNYLLSLFRK